jgi:zinc protease
MAVILPRWIMTSLNRDELATFYKKFYTEGKCLMFVAGKPPADVDQQLNKVFGHLPFNTSVIPDIQYNLQPAENKKYNIINDAEGVQGAIRIARQFPNRHHPDFAKAQVLNNIYGGFLDQD